MKYTMKIFKSTVGLGIINYPDGTREIVQFKTAREIKGRTFSDIIWFEEPSDELKVVAFYATFHKNNIY